MKAIDQWQCGDTVCSRLSMSSRSTWNLKKKDEREIERERLF